MPTNAAQWIGYDFVTIAVLAVGITLIFVDVRRIRQNPPE